MGVEAPTHLDEPMCKNESGSDSSVGKLYRDKETLEYFYHDRGMSTTEIGERLDCSRTTVLRWLTKHDIDRRDRKQAAKDALRVDYARYVVGPKGHTMWQTDPVEKRSTRSVRVHRLMAVAEHGMDAVDDKIVHHKNGVPWDNRVENLEIMTNSEHSKKHWERGDISGKILNAGKR